MVANAALNGIIDAAYTKKFDTNVRYLASQTGSKLRNAFEMEDLTGAESKAIEQLGILTLGDPPSRHGDTPTQEADHERRWVSSLRKVGGIYLDTADQLRMLIQPGGRYAVRLAQAAGRAIDTIAINSFTATVQAGKDAGATFAFDSGQIIAVDYVPSGSPSTSGLTLEKLIHIHELFDANNVEGEKHIAITSRQKEQLMNIDEFRSFDYRSSKSLETGQIEGVTGMGFQVVPTFMGFYWHVFGTNTTNGVSLPLSGGNRSCFAWIKEQMVLGMTQDVTTFVDVVPEKQRSILTQTFVDVGAVRLQENSVVEILCNEP